MTEDVSCPQCQARLRLPVTAAASKVKCPKCGATFSGKPPAPPEPVPDLDLSREAEEAEPPPRAASGGPPPLPTEGRGAERPTTGWEEIPILRPLSDEAHVWRSVRTGAGLYLWGHCLYLAGLVLLFLVMLSGAGTSSRSPDRGLALMLVVLTVFALLAILTNWILAVVASGFWVPAPVGHGARGLALASLTVAGLVLLELPRLLSLMTAGPLRGTGEEFGGRFGPGSPLGLSGPVLLLGLIEMGRLSLFPFFLRAAGLGLKAAALASQGLALGIGTVALFAAVTLLNLLLSLSAVANLGPSWTAHAGPALGQVLIYLNLVVLLGLLLWGVLVLSGARHDIRSKLRHLEPPKAGRELP